MWPEVAKERSAPEGSSLFLSNHPVARKSRREKGKKEKEEKGASDVLCAWPGLVKWASPCPGMIPVCSELGLPGADWKIPRSGRGPCQPLGKMSFQSLRASSPRFPLIQAVGYAALGCRLEAGAPEGNPARPLALLAKPPPGAGDSPGKRRQRSCSITEWAVRCAGEGIREGFLEEVTPEDQVEINQKTNGG